MLKVVTNILKEKEEEIRSEINTLDRKNKFIDELCNTELNSPINLFDLPAESVLFAYILSICNSDLSFDEVGNITSKVAMLGDKIKSGMAPVELLDHLKSNFSIPEFNDFKDHISTVPEKLIFIYSEIIKGQGERRELSNINLPIMNDYYPFLDIKNHQQLKQLIDSFIKKRHPELMEALGQVANYARVKHGEYTNRLKFLHKQDSAYVRTIDHIEGVGDKEFCSVPRALPDINDEDTKVAILKLILDYDNKVTDDLQEEYNSLTTSEEIAMHKLFNKYGIDIDDYNIDIELPIRNMKYILSTLYDIGIKDSESMLKIVNVTSFEHIKTIQSLLSNQIVSKNFLCSNLQLLNPSSESASNFLKNISELGKYLSLKSGKYDVESFILIDSNIITSNIKTIRDYRLVGSLRNCDNIRFLTNIDLEKKLTLLIELGMIDSIKNDMSILNYSYDRLKRLKVSSLLGEKIENVHDLLNQRDYPISDIDLDKYIPTNSKQDHANSFISKAEFLSRLQKYEVDEYVYNISGILISKKKVLNALEKMEYVSDKSISDILFKDSYLDDYGCLKVHSLVMGNNRNLSGKN